MYQKRKNEKDILYILNHLRPEDLHEVKTSRGKNFKKQIPKEIMQSNAYFVLGVEKKTQRPAVMGGCVEVEKGVGMVWLLATPIALKHRICLLRHLKKNIENFDQKYWLTYNFLWKENTIAKTWLKKFGYRFPAEEENKTFLDNQFLNISNIPKDFEVFYRIRETRGLI